MRPFLCSRVSQAGDDEQMEQLQMLLRQLRNQREQLQGDGDSPQREPSGGMAVDSGSEAPAGGVWVEELPSTEAEANLPASAPSGDLMEE